LLGVAERGIVRNLLESDGLTQVGKISEQLDDAAKVGLEELAQGQDGKQLMLGEILAAVVGGVERQCPAGGEKSFAGKGDRRLGHGTHGEKPPSPPTMMLLSARFACGVRGFQQSKTPSKLLLPPEIVENKFMKYIDNRMNRLITGRKSSATHYICYIILTIALYGCVNRQGAIKDSDLYSIKSIAEINVLCANLHNIVYNNNGVFEYTYVNSDDCIDSKGNAITCLYAMEYKGELIYFAKHSKMISFSGDVNCIPKDIVITVYLDNRSNYAIYDPFK
jgi:hypothetical protein